MPDPRDHLPSLSAPGIIGWPAARALRYPRDVLPTGHLLAFTLLSFALIVAPGPNVLFVVSRSLQLGRAAGICTALGGQIGIGASLAVTGRKD
jgi:hypothetical protein